VGADIFVSRATNNILGSRRGYEMDMMILFLVIGGNVLVFGGFFSLLSRTIFREQDQKHEESEVEEELKQLERELKSL